MTSTALTLRPAHHADHDALERLAALDSTRVPAGPHLVAERDGQIVAAVSESAAIAFADPFLPTAEAVALLHRWAAQRVGGERRHAQGLGPRVHLA